MPALASGIFRCNRAGKRLSKGCLPMSIQIYGFWRSIASFRVRVALRVKGMPFEEIPLDILSGEQFKPEYKAVNADRVGLTFFHNGYCILHSLSIFDLSDAHQ